MQHVDQAMYAVRHVPGRSTICWKEEMVKHMHRLAYTAARLATLCHSLSAGNANSCCATTHHRPNLSAGFSSAAAAVFPADIWQ